MPFTVTINAKNAGTKEVVYTLTPSPKKTELSAELAEQINNLDINKTVEKLKERRDKALEENSSMIEKDSELPVVASDEEPEEPLTVEGDEG